MTAALFVEGERLAEIERKRVEVMRELQVVAQRQKALGSEMRRLEWELRAELKHVPEHRVPEDRALELDDVERWCRSEYFNLAHSMSQNPHAYFSRKRSRHPRMYERVVEFILANGYRQRYRGSVYTCLDVRMHSGMWFVWPMHSDPALSQVLNAKPDSMRPGEEDAW